MLNEINYIINIYMKVNILKSNNLTTIILFNKKFSEMHYSIKYDDKKKLMSNNILYNYYMLKIDSVVRKSIVLNKLNNNNKFKILNSLRFNSLKSELLLYNYLYCYYVNCINNNILDIIIDFNIKLVNKSKYSNIVFDLIDKTIGFKLFIDKLYYILTDTNTNYITNIIIESFLCLIMYQLYNKKTNIDTKNSSIKYILCKNYLSNIIMYKTWGNKEAIKQITNIIEIIINCNIINLYKNKNTINEINILHSLCNHECIEPSIKSMLNKMFVNK